MRRPSLNQRYALHIAVVIGCLGCGRLSYEALDGSVGVGDGSADSAFETGLMDTGLPDTGMLADADTDARVMVVAAGDADVDAQAVDAGSDATTPFDAGSDATDTIDAGVDSGVDSGGDAGVDAGPYGELPCEVTAVWQTDFASDPTQDDRDMDSMPDWIVRGGGAFPSSELTAGVWTSMTPTPLDTNPPLNITTTAYVDVSMRSLRSPAPVAAEYEGALFWVNVDYTLTDFAAIFVSIARTEVDEQEVRFYGKSAMSTTVVLIGPVTVGPDLARIRMQIDPATSTLTASIDDVSVGSAMFPRLSDLNNDKFATAFAASTPSEYDYARVAICVP